MFGIQTFQFCLVQLGKIVQLQNEIKNIESLVLMNCIDCNCLVLYIFTCSIVMKFELPQDDSSKTNTLFD